MSFRKVIYFLFALVIIMAGAFFYLKSVNEKTGKQEEKTVSVPEKPEEKPPSGLPKLAIVIDDIGNSKELGEEVLSINNVTIAIIPELKYSLYFAERAHKKGKDILVHMPMEPKNKDKYGGDTTFLKVDMSSGEIKKITESLLKTVPYAKGVNNHMGSEFTENQEKLMPFFEVLKKRGLFFLDSRTSAESRAFETSITMGIKGYKRDVFLDHEVDEEKISKQLDIAVSEAYRKGYAIAIGHPHPETISVLKRRFKEIAKTVEIVPLSKIP